MAKNIVLTGLMGSGKTAVGHLLERMTGMTFLDTDEKTAEKAQKSINRIFEEDSEDHFRNLESEIIEEVSRTSGCIISTGGGAVLKAENIENLKKTGILFYLAASAEALYERIKDDYSRPLLKGDDPKEVLKKLLIERKPCYEKANFKVNTENKALEEVARQILELYQQYSA